jgi:tetratricopeptide (TPR) repeat protein
MIDWQLGEKDRARRWYDQALVWMAKRDPQNQGLRHIRKEATAVLGLPEPSAPSKQQVEQHESAIHAAIYTLVLEINPRAAWVYPRRAECFAALAQWDKAAADYTQTLSPQTPHETCCQLACTRLLAGDSKGYQQLCQWARERASATTQPLSPYMASRIGILSPHGGIDPAQLVRWAEQAVASQPKCEWFLHALGAAHYRAGDFEQAIRRCRESLQVAPDWGGRMLNWLILALAHQRLGHTKEARLWLNQAIQWRKDHALQGKGKDEFLSPPGLHPSDWLEFNVLIREAEALVNTPSTQVPDGGPRTRDQKKRGR